jgi:hypothetical protein
VNASFNDPAPLVPVGGSVESTVESTTVVVVTLGTVVVVLVVVVVVVVEDPAIVTTVEPWLAIPNVSATRVVRPVMAKVVAGERLDVTGPRPARALDVTEIVHSVLDVWVIASIESIPVTSKSSPIVLERVEQITVSFASSVNSISPEDAVAALACRTRSGPIANFSIEGFQEMARR